MSRRAATVTMTTVLALVLAACSSRSPENPASSAPPSSAPDAAAPAPIPTVVVLDASDSMNTPDALGPRIDAAKKAVTALAEGLPDRTTFGIYALGATKPAATTPIEIGCGDISTVVPVAPLDKTSVTRALEPLKAQGYTPLGAAIRSSAASLPAGTASLVIVSDGEPNCSPDPCETTAAIRAARPDLTISTVGFKSDVPALKCVADKGGGIYVTADNTAQLIARLTAVQNTNLAATRLTTTGRGDMKLGDRLDDIRARHGDFPTAGETSSNRTVYIWKDCAYGIENGILVDIAPLAQGNNVPGSGGSTIDGVSAGSSMSRVVELYGKPVADQNGTAVFATGAASRNAYRIGYTGGLNDGTVTTVILCSCLPSVPTSAPVTPSAPTATIDGYGAVKLGMNEAEVHAVLPPPDKKETRTGRRSSESDYTMFTYGELSVDIDPKEGVIAISTPSGTKTDRGVGQGSTATQIVEAYSRDHDVIWEGHLAQDFLIIRPKNSSGYSKSLFFNITANAAQISQNTPTIQYDYGDDDYPRPLAVCEDSRRQATPVPGRVIEFACGGS